MDTVEMDDLGDADSWSLLSWLASCFIVFGGVLPYIPQYQDIQRSSNADGFSTWVCLVLLLANILRIFFWFGKFFELALLLQSIVMIATMLVMLNLCCSVQSINKVATKRHFFTGSHLACNRAILELSASLQTLTCGYFSECANCAERNWASEKYCKQFWGLPHSDFDLQHFWKWSRFVDYLQFCLVVTFLCTFVTYIFIDADIFVEGLGFVAVLTEAMLGIPQLLKNFQKKSTQGMSVSMVLLWTAGDTFKTVYFIINHSPAQFWLCGALQIGIDLAILVQVYSYHLQAHYKFR